MTNAIITNIPTSDIVIMNGLSKFSFFLLLLLPEVTWSADLTGRFSMQGTTAKATQGDLGYVNKDNTLTADQQSLRLMLDDSSKDNEWSIHIKSARIHVTDILYSSEHASDLFRYNKLSSNWSEEKESNNTTLISYEIDRAVYKQRFKNATFSLGRQAIDWGSGRFWQPLNVFGSFSPTDLDTDYKAGIDATRIDWFPTNFSSLSAVYTLSAKDNSAVDNTVSAAIYYKSQAGEQSEFSLLAGSIIDNTVFGASFESTWSGIGWRLEARQTNFKTSNENTLFWIAGLDYQFANGTLLTAEWYENSRGAENAGSLSKLQTDTYIRYGLQQHLSQRVLGFSLSKEITPLFNGGYILLASPIKNTDGQQTTSLLQQLNLTYSVSNESDILFSYLLANGQGLNLSGKALSEFGHLPASLTIRLRFYF